MSRPTTRGGTTDPPARATTRILTAVRSRSAARRRRWLLILVVATLLEPVAMKLRGYRIGGNLVVRCRRGHLFTTIWIPGVSFKSLRIGWWRVQRCPVGKHWSIVTPVKVSALSDAEQQLATEYKDIRLP